jgi:hypothetical protein
VLVRSIRCRRARDEPVAWPSGWSRHVNGRHLDADAGRAVATWAGRDFCACRRSTRQRHGSCHDQTCERFTPYAACRHFTPFLSVELVCPHSPTGRLPNRYRTATGPLAGGFVALSVSSVAPCTCRSHQVRLTARSRRPSRRELAKRGAGSSLARRGTRARRGPKRMKIRRPFCRREPQRASAFDDKQELEVVA